MADELTYMTDVHVAVVEQLERWGLGVMVEVEFPPYRADIYLSSFHAAVEVDGPRHSEKADRKRNRELNRAYGLYVFHVPATDAERPARWKEDFQTFLNGALKTRGARWEKYGIRTPWL